MAGEKKIERLRAGKLRSDGLKPRDEGGAICFKLNEKNAASASIKSDLSFF
jgi:hypothetical protein